MSMSRKRLPSEPRCSLTIRFWLAAARRMFDSRLCCRSVIRGKSSCTLVGTPVICRKSSLPWTPTIRKAPSSFEFMSRRMNSSSCRPEDCDASGWSTCCFCRSERRAAMSINRTNIVIMIFDISTPSQSPNTEFTRREAVGVPGRSSGCPPLPPTDPDVPD